MPLLAGLGRFSDSYPCVLPQHTGFAEVHGGNPTRKEGSQAHTQPDLRPVSLFVHGSGETSWALASRTKPGPAHFADYANYLLRKNLVLVLTRMGLDWRKALLTTNAPMSSCKRPLQKSGDVWPFLDRDIPIASPNTGMPVRDTDGFPARILLGGSFGAKGRHVSSPSRQPKALGCRDPDFGWKHFLTTRESRFSTGAGVEERFAFPMPAGSIPLNSKNSEDALRQTETSMTGRRIPKSSWPASFLHCTGGDASERDDWLQQGKTEE